MHPRSVWSAHNVCLSCQWRISNSRLASTLISRRTQNLARLLPSRRFHLTATRSQVIESGITSLPSDPTLISRHPSQPFKKHLQQWEQKFCGPSDEVLSAFGNFYDRETTQNVLSRSPSAAKSDEHDTTNELGDAEEDDLDEIITIGLFLKPGDVVELSQDGREPVLAVFVQQLDSVSQFFSVNGRWSHSLLAKVAFAITGCIDPKLLQPLIPYLPTNPAEANPKGEVHVPTNIAAPVQAKLERMTEEAEEIYRTNAPILDAAYDRLADSTRTRMMSLTQMAKRLLSPGDPTWTPSAAALLAVRKALHQNEFRFHSDLRSHRLTNVFSIRSRSDVQTIEAVHEWIREYREFIAMNANDSSPIVSLSSSTGANNIHRFLEKARKLITQSRQDRDPILGGLGPSKSRLAGGNALANQCYLMGEIFTDSDQKIINFLQAWVLTGQFKSMAGLHAACSSLIQATHCYGPNTIKHAGSQQPVSADIGRRTGMVFLQEIGVLSPYENRALYDEQLMLPTVRLSRNMEVLNTKAELVRKNPDFTDSMADLRRDWGSTTVYCIDDIGAHEIDDGVSIERIHGKSSEYWIHVHVANPTAFFDKTHTLAGLAAHMTQSVYTPERFYPMIPQWATEGHFSLDKNRPVITFSSRVDNSGGVLEIKIQHGVIKNIVTITPSEVGSALGKSTTRDYNRLVVGGSAPDAAAGRVMPQLTPQQLQDLQDIYDVSQARWRSRTAAGAVSLGYSQLNVCLYEKTSQRGLTWHPPSSQQARYIQTDPIIEVSSPLLWDSIKLDADPSHIVEEMMILACHTAASWCAERYIPVMYRGTVQPPSGSGPPAERIKEAVVEYQKQGREVPLDLVWQYMKSLGRAIAHTEPLAHKLIAVPSYVKVTSPLRRFSDMIAHWQIEAAMRYEARTGRKFNGAEVPNATAKASAHLLPFSRRQMQESIVTLSPRERIIGIVNRDSTKYWCYVAFMRAFNYNEGKLPDSFKFGVRFVSDTTSADTRKGAVGQLSEYGLKATLLHDTDVQVGDEWDVRLDSVDVFSQLIFVRPIRLLGRVSASP